MRPTAIDVARFVVCRLSVCWEERLRSKTELNNLVPFVATKRSQDSTPTFLT